MESVFGPRCMERIRCDVGLNGCVECRYRDGEEIEYSTSQFESNAFAYLSNELESEQSDRRLFFGAIQS